MQDYFTLHMPSRFTFSYHMGYDATLRTKACGRFNGFHSTLSSNAITTYRRNFPIMKDTMLFTMKLVGKISREMWQI